MLLWRGIPGGFHPLSCGGRQNNSEDFEAGSSYPLDNRPQNANKSGFLQVNDAEGRDNSNPPFHILMGTFHDDLLRWRNSLPKHLRFHEEHMDSYNPRESPYDWKARQRSSIRIRKCLGHFLLLLVFRLWEYNVFLRCYIDLLTTFRL
jgi:hypothetical protein